MRVRLIRPRLDDDPERYELHLKPDTDEDRATLQELVDSGFDCGFGMDAATWTVGHCQVQIRRE